MSEEVLTMSNKELKRLEIVQKLVDERINQREAAHFLGCTARNVRYLLKRYKKDGAKGLISRKRAKRSNRAYTETYKAMVMEVIGTKYHDFGPTLASEMLKERDELIVSKETTRQWMIEAGLWLSKQKKAPKAHPPRESRPYYGQLIQIDGSPHDWFEGRSEPCCLIVFVDDATSKIQLIRFYKAETTFAYFETAKLYMARYGMPIALYSDKHGIFRINAHEPEHSSGLTQFGRAMRDLGVELIHAHSPQAKGKVENKNKTLQDRLIKEMRLDGINTMAQANDGYLDAFTERYNKKFARDPLKPEDAHLKIPEAQDLSLHFTHQEQRKVSKNLTVSYKGKVLVIEMPGKARQLHQASVTVCESQCGNLTLLYKEQSLPFTLYNKTQYYSEPVHRKEVYQRPLKQRRRAKPAPEHPFRQPWSS